MFWSRKRARQNLEVLTCNLAQDFADIRQVFYSGCLEGIAGASGGTWVVQPALTTDGHFVVGSFQMWLMLGILDWKREKYLRPSAAQEFVDRMYGGVIGPNLPEGTSAEAAGKGVLRFRALAREGQHKPYEEFWHRMQEIIFDGKCDITGYWRSSRALGLHIGMAQGMGMRVAVHHMTLYLINATQLAVAQAFGDTQFAIEQAGALERLASGEGEATQ